MEIFIILGIYIIEVIKYHLALDIVFKEKMRRRWPCYVGGVVVLLYMLLAGGDAEQDYIVTYFMVMIITAVIVGGKIKDRVVKTLLLWILVSSIEEMAELFSRKIGSYFYFIPNYWYLVYLMNAAWGLVILGALFLLYRRNVEKVRLSKRKVMLITVLNGVVIELTVAALNYAKGYVENKTFQYMTNFLVTVAYISMCLLFWLLIYFREQDEQKTRRLELEEELMQAQEGYYRMLLQKEENTRKFRHDIENHLLCINELARKESTEELKRYLEDLSGEIRQIRNMSYATGNEMIDVILYDKFSGIGEGIRVDVRGRLGRELNLSDMDLCTVFSNLFQNAVEELGRQEAGWFRLELRQGREYAEVAVSNSVDSPVALQSNGLPKTRKGNTKNHGLGLQNVRAVIERNGGSFEIASMEDCFEVKIQLHNPTNSDKI